MPKAQRSWLQERLAQIQLVFNVDNQRAFAMASLGAILEVDDDEALFHTEPCPEAPGIDGWYHDIEADQFHLLVAKWTDRTTPLGGRAVRALHDAVAPFCTTQRSGASSVEVDTVWAAWRDARQEQAAIVIHFLINVEMMSDALYEVRQLGSTLEAHPWIEVWTPERLAGLEQTSSDDGMKGVTLGFRTAQSSAIVVDSPHGAPRLLGRSIVVNLSGAGIAEVAAQYKARIVRANVRHHLGTRNRVNSKLRTTLRDAAQHKFFWYYNNGVTILADDFKWKPEKSMLQVLNPQVVNGCQTITSIIEMGAEVPADVSVIAKVIIVKDENDGYELASAISERTNEQTPVKYSDLRSNDAIHVKLRSAFERLDPPWYYELKRGDWNSLARAQKLRFTAKRKVDKVQVAQCWRMFAGEPAEAALNVEAMFADSAVYHTVFNGERHAADYMLACVVHHYWLDKLAMSQFDALKKMSPGLDFQISLLERMLRTRKHVAGHLTALTGAAFETVYGDLTGVLSVFLAREWQENRLLPVQRIVFATFRAWATDREHLKLALNKHKAFIDLRARLLDNIAMLYGEDFKLKLPHWSGRFTPGIMTS